MNGITLACGLGAVALCIAVALLWWGARDLRRRTLRLRRRWLALDAQLAEALDLRTRALAAVLGQTANDAELVPLRDLERGIYRGIHRGLGDTVPTSEARRRREVAASLESRRIRHLLARVDAARPAHEASETIPTASALIAAEQTPSVALDQVSLAQLREASQRLRMVRRIYNDCVNHALRLRRKLLCRLLGLSHLLHPIETFECDDELAHD